MIRNTALRGALLALPLLLAGCAALQPPPVPPSVAQAERNYHPTLTAGGRLSIRYQGLNGPEVMAGRFEWHQTPAATRIALLSPLGQTIARIVVAPGGATLQQAGQPPRAAKDADALTAQTLGWPLPVAGLHDWLQGFGTDMQGRRFVATPASDSFTTDDGWHVQYPAWQDDGSGSARPRRVDLSRRTDQAGEVTIRIVLDTWQTP